MGGMERNSANISCLLLTCFLGQPLWPLLYVSISPCKAGADITCIFQMRNWGKTKQNSLLNNLPREVKYGTFLLDVYRVFVDSLSNSQR